MKILLFFLLLIAPFVLISLPGIPEWLGRTVGTALFIYVVSVTIFWAGISPKARIFRQGGMLSEARFDAVRPRIEKELRIFLVLVGVGFTAWLTVPFSIDVVELAARGKPARVSGRAVETWGSIWGLWFVVQGMVLSGPGTKHSSYSLLYSYHRLRVGQYYECTVLPHSRIVLDCREVNH